MSRLTKALLLFPIVLLSLILFAIPVYSEPNEQQLPEQQGHETVQESDQVQEEGQEVRTEVVSTEEGIYNLTFLTNANLRSEPAAGSKSVVIIPFGIELTSDQKITNTSGETWYSLTYSGMSGYISSDVVDVKVPDTDDTDGTAESPEDAETSIREQPEESVPVNAPADSSSESEADGQSGETIISETDSNTDKPAAGKVDSIFIVFLLVAIVGIWLSFIVFNRLVREYSKYRRQILRKRKEKDLQDW